jgi:hypothetical protein
MLKLIRVLALVGSVGGGTAAGARFFAGPPLDDATVTRFIAAQHAMRASVSSLAKRARSGAKGDASGAALTGVAQMEATVKAAGFSDLQDYMATAARIGLELSRLEAHSFGDSLAAGSQDAHAQMDAALNDPNVPEEAKVQIRAQMGAVQAKLASHQPWAAGVMGIIDRVSHPQSSEAVARHREELKAALR